MNLTFHESEKNSVFFRCVEDSNDAVMMTDVSGVLIYVNRAWQSIFKYSAEEAIGQSPRLLRSKHQDSNFYQQLWSEILDPAKGYWRGEIINRAKDGTEIPVLLSITPYRNQENQLLGYLGISLDMGETKKLQEQIIQQDRLASIGLLASGLAHEIGTPLGVIRGRAEYLQNLNTSNLQLTKGLEIIISQIDRISKLFYSLLHLAKPSKSEVSRPVEIQAALAEVLSLVRQQGEKLGIRFDLYLHSDARVEAEMDRLQQVFLNLIMNSIHAIEETQKTQPTISIQTHESSLYWTIEIKDSGCGISKENLKNLFKPFFTTKDTGKGTGLGLAISKQIIESWNGTIEGDSKIDEGTSFFIRLRRV